MAPKLDILKCYEVLDIPPGATVEQVRRSYLELAHVWDPAQHVDNPPLRHVSEQKRLEIDEAYNALAEFLPDLRRHPKPETPPVSSARPADAIEDQIVHTPPPETRTLAIAIVATGLVSLLLLMGLSIWREMTSLTNRPTLAVSEEK